MIFLGHAGMWQGLLQAMCRNRHGRFDRRKKVYGVPWIEIQPKVTILFCVLLEKSL